MNPERQRQHQANKARRAKLFPQCRAIPVMIVRSDVEPLPPPPPLPQQRNAHVTAFHRQRVRIPAAAVLGAVARITGVDADLIVSPCRKPAVSRARWIAIFIFSSETGRSTVQIGSAVGKDHSSVVHVLNKMRERLPADQELRDTVHAVRREMGIPAALVEAIG